MLLRVTEMPRQCGFEHRFTYPVIAGENGCSRDPESIAPEQEIAGECRRQGHLLQQVGMYAQFGLDGNVRRESLASFWPSEGAMDWPFLADCKLI